MLQKENGHKLYERDYIAYARSWGMNLLVCIIRDYDAVNGGTIPLWKI